MDNDWPAHAFVEYGVRSGLSRESAKSYASYLRRVDSITGGLDKRLATLSSKDAALDWTHAALVAAKLPHKSKSNCLSALRLYLNWTGNS